MFSYIKGYTLFHRSPILVRGYILLLCTLSAAFSIWDASPALMVLAAFLLGIHFGPHLPVWKDVESESEKRLVTYLQAGPMKQLGYYWALVPICTVAMLVIAAIKQLAIG